MWVARRRVGLGTEMWHGKSENNLSPFFCHFLFLAYSTAQRSAKIQIELFSLSPIYLFIYSSVYSSIYIYLLIYFIYLYFESMNFFFFLFIYRVIYIFRDSLIFVRLEKVVCLMSRTLPSEMEVKISVVSAL